VAKAGGWPGTGGVGAAAADALAGGTGAAPSAAGTPGGTAAAGVTKGVVTGGDAGAAVGVVGAVGAVATVAQPARPRAMTAALSVADGIVEKPGLRILVASGRDRCPALD